MTPVDGWPAALEAALATCRHFRDCIVLAETDSTQTLAHGRSDEPGLLVTAGRQLRGRGRLGRAWADTHDEGIAASFVVADAPTERLAALSAVACAAALEPVIGRDVGIKWPNDIVVDRRKLAGILIERGGAAKPTAIVGIGINVRQRAFAPELAGRATSLAMLGGAADRLDVLVGLLRSLDRTLDATEDQLREEYARRDALRGTVATFGSAQGDVTGEVLRVDPWSGIAVRTAHGERWLPPATSAVKSWTG